MDRFAEGVRQVLVAVAETDAIKDKDPARCTAYLQGIAKGYPAYMLLAVNDAEGRTVCNTAGGAPGTNSNAGRAYFQRAMAGNAFAVGDQVIGVETKRRSLHFALPLPDRAGKPAGIVLVSIDLGWLTSHLCDRGTSTRIKPDDPGPSGHRACPDTRHGTVGAGNRRLTTSRQPLRSQGTG